MILTRWHPLDIAADRLKDMETGDGDQWEIIEIPALNDEEGEKPSSNWPERWPVKRLMQTKRVIGSYEWSALYQQNPTIRGGNILQAENIQIHTDPADFPKTKYYRAWDLASTAKQRSKDNPDFTVGTLGAMTTEKDPATGADIPHLWIKHAVFMQEEAPRRDQKILTTTDADGPGVTVIVESYAAYKDAYTTLKDTLRGQRIVKGRAYKMDKLSKVSPAEPIFEAGNVHVMAGDWVDEWQKQHLEFTGLDGGAHDDAVDTTGLIVREYRKARSGLAMG
jgi:predicted phage terminase large subunit-like protein